MPAHFDFIKRLGSGGQGDCSLVECRDTRKLRVRKTCKDHRVFAMNHMNSEVKINLHLPRFHRIPQLVQSRRDDDAGVTDLYFEFCDAGDLGSLIKAYRREEMLIPEAFLWHIYIHIAEALAFLHYGIGAPRDGKRWEQVVHRDVKPDNVFLKWKKGADKSKEYPDAYLGDLGLAVLVTDRKYNRKTRSGTQAWRAPELPIGDAKSDVWSLGAVVCAMVNEGKPPIKPLPPDSKLSLSAWESMAASRTVMRIDHEYSEELQSWMLRAMTMDPSKRISSEELVRDMTAIGREIRSETFVPLERWSYPKQIV